MNIFYWICCGIDNDNTCGYLFDFCKAYSSVITSLVEPMISSSSFSQRFLDRLCMVLVAMNVAKLLILWVLVSSSLTTLVKAISL